MIPGSRPHFFVDWQQGKEANLCRQLAAVVHHGVGRRTLWPRPSLIRRHHPRLPPLVCTNRISSADSNKKKVPDATVGVSRRKVWPDGSSREVEPGPEMAGDKSGCWCRTLLQ